MKYLHRTYEGERLWPGINWQNERSGWGVKIVIGNILIRFRFRKKYKEYMTRRIFFNIKRKKDLLKPMNPIPPDA